MVDNNSNSDYTSDSKKEISQKSYKKLGDRLRENVLKKELNNEQDLHLLQNLRKSYKPVLAEVFSILETCMRKIDKRSIATYRIKRIESIISKLQRQPKMQLQRMEDIAGCRCIMKDHNNVYRLKTLLEEKLIIKSDRNDYIKNTKEDGYRSLHLIVCIQGKENQPIEIQLRSESDHNWATLVEITDLIYGTKIKETGTDHNLARFLYLLSKGNFTQMESFEIVKIMKKEKFADKLHDIFYTNSIEVRRQWEVIEKKTSDNYYLIKSNKNSVPQISSFKYYNDAEDKYFNEFLNNDDSNIVLTYFPKAKFEQISKAYSNYTLTYHNFLREILPILLNICKNSSLYHFFITSNLYFNILKKSIKLQFVEYLNVPISKHKILSQKEWKKDITTRIKWQFEALRKLTSCNPNDNTIVRLYKFYIFINFKLYMKSLFNGKLEQEYYKYCKNQ